MNGGPGWRERLDQLVDGGHSGTGDPLDAGARLVVTDPDGTERFRAALARHTRDDLDQPGLTWVRPVTGRYPDPDTGEPRFALALARRRGLDVIHGALVDDDRVRLTLRNGQTAHVEPASGAELDDLTAWDQFTLDRLTAGELAELDALDADGWYGRYG